MANISWLVQSCCNPSVINYVEIDSFLLSPGVSFQDSLGNCYTVIEQSEEIPTIFFTNRIVYTNCLDCTEENPCNPPVERPKIWLVESCCNPGITQIISDNTLIPGDIFQDINGNCYTVLTATSGFPTIVRGNSELYRSCSACKPCASPSPTPTPSITQTPFPTPSTTPSVTVTPSPTTYKFANSSPSPTPTATVSVTPSITPSINTPECKCITFTNTDPINSYNCFYTNCGGTANIRFSLDPEDTAQVCGSDPSVQDPAVTFYTGSYCQGGQCVKPDISPSPTPTPSPTLVSGSLPEPADLCMDVVFGPAPSPSATPSLTVSVTPSITVSPSPYPLYPSITPTSTPSATPSVTPSKTPSISVSSTPSTTPSITPTKTTTLSVTPSTTPSITISPSKTPTPSPTPASGSIVVPECSVLVNDSYGAIFSYDSTTNTSTFLLTLAGSPDIAHTTNKLWIYSLTNIFEYNITLNPFTSNFNRTINLPIGVVLGAGLCAVNDTTLISSNAADDNRIIKITLNPSPDNTVLIENLFYLTPGRKISGDLLYTTDGKIILTSQTDAPTYYYISQYALINGVWTLEFDLPINTIPFPYGLATINGGIYIFSSNNLNQINTTFPYNITFINTTGILTNGSSQVPSCNNVSFQPNIIPASPSPTPTPTKTVTPSITASPSITPSRTPSKTPSSSPPSSNCTGVLPLPGGNFVYNGVVVTASGTGVSSLSSSPYASCNTTTPAGTVILGNTGNFSYTLTFSQPVNSIRLLITALGTNPASPTSETFIFNTSGGTPTITSLNSCQCTVTSNLIIANNPTSGNGGGGLFTISAPSSFNTLTITGPGGAQGSIFGIDCTSIAPPSSTDCASCNIQALPTLGTGSITNGNLTVSTTYNGPTIPTFPSTTSGFMTCVGITSPGAGSTIILGNQPGPFTYILNFNQPVNNIKFLIEGGGIPGSSLYESFTFNTSGGVPILSACGTSCGTIINNNILQLTFALPYGGGVLTQVKATNPYNQIIITGNGGLAGATFSLCLDTAITVPSSSPTPTPSKTATPSKTPSVTVSPSKTPSKTPSVTPSKTATPSITVSPSRTPSITPSSSPPSAACPMIYTESSLTPNGSGGYYTKNYTWDPNTNVQQEIVLPNDVNGADIASTGTKLWKSWALDPLSPASYLIKEWNLSGNPPYTATFSRNLTFPTGYYRSPGLTAKDNNTLVDVYPFTINGQTTYKVYELNIPAFPATQMTLTFKFNLNSNFRGQGDLMLTSDANGNPDKLLVLGAVSNPTPGTTNQLVAIQQYDYNTGAFEYESILPNSQALSVAGIAQYNNTIYAFSDSNAVVYTINPNPPYNWTVVNNVIKANGANSIMSCSKGKLLGPSASGCNTMLYRTQTNGYGSYNFTTNTSTPLSVTANPYPANDTTNNIPKVIANTSNKMWVYAAGSNSLEINLRESNITLSPFTSTFNRNITLPSGFKPGNGLFALNNTTLVGTRLDSVNNSFDSIVELDISNNVATYTTKCNLPRYERPVGGLIVTSGANPKLIVLVSSFWLLPAPYGYSAILQFDYTTGALEFRKIISPTVTTPSGLAEVNGNIYIVGYNVYKIDTVAPYNLTLVQTTGIQLINTSQLASCIDTKFPTPDCNCDVRILSQNNILTYNGVTIVPSYVGPVSNYTNGVYPFLDTACNGTDVVTTPAGTIILGQYNNSLGPFTYTLTFSQPVNNITLVLTGMGVFEDPALETFTFTTDGGTPTLTSCKGCFNTINGNTVSADGNFVNPFIGKGGQLTITSPTNYNTLTISGSGGLLGTTFAICANSIAPAPPPAIACPIYYFNVIYTPSYAINTYYYNVLTNTSTLTNLESQAVKGGNGIAHTDTRLWTLGNTTTGPDEPGGQKAYVKIYEYAKVNNLNFTFLRFLKIQLPVNHVSAGAIGLAYKNSTTLISERATATGPYPVGSVNFQNPTIIEIDITGNGSVTDIFNPIPERTIAGLCYTSTGKLIITSRNKITGISYITQYAYPSGIVEFDLPLTSVIPLQPQILGGDVAVFESNGIIYFSTSYPSYTLYKIDSTSPYTIATVYTTSNPSPLYVAASKTDCNTVDFVPNLVPPSPTPTPSPSPPSANALGCVYYNSGGSLYNYNPATNTSSPPITLSNLGAVFSQNDTHTLNKYWKANNTNLIQEWILTNNPTTLALNRNISINTGYAYFYYSFAIDDNTLLALLTNTPGGATTGNVNAVLARINITNNTVTPAQVTSLFNVGFPNTSLGFGAMLLTSTNKLLYVGTRFNSNNSGIITYLRQYSYPDGALELEINLSPFIPVSATYGNYCKLFEFGGNIFFTLNGQPTLTPTNIYQINLNSPYTVTSVGTLPGVTQGWNSSLNCNTVNFNTPPTPGPLTLSKVTCDDGLLADNFHNNSVCGLLNESPALDWTSPGYTSTNVASYEILCEDTSASNFIHWKVTGISPNQTSIAQNGTWISNPSLVVYPTGYPSGDRVNGWNGPCPPSGTHNYRIQVTARLTNGATVTSNYSTFTATQARNFKTIYKYLDIQ